jgi:hypothetical protein
MSLLAAEYPAHAVCRFALGGTWRVPDTFFDGADSSKELPWGGMAVLEQEWKAEGGGRNTYGT